MHFFVFSLLRIKSLFIFRALFALRQDALYTQTVPVVYAVPPDDEQIVLETCREC
jgi:hypothetical protein